MVQSFWKTVQEFCVNLNTHLPCNSAKHTPGYVCLKNEKLTFSQNSVPEYSWQLYLWSPKTGNQPRIFNWVNATIIHLYNEILFTDFSQLSIELCLNIPFSVENIIGGKCI